jgi:hypothetical protein
MPDVSRMKDSLAQPAATPTTVVSDTEDSESQADSDTSSDDDLCDIDTPESPTSPSPWRRQATPEKTLKDAIRRRANEQVMFANLKHLTFKGKMRYGGRLNSTCSELTPAEVLFRRQAVGLKAANFTELYSDTLGILEAHMTLKPPARARHSITSADLGAYASTLETISRPQHDNLASEECREGVTRLTRRIPTCPAGFSFEPLDRTTVADDLGESLQVIEGF